MSSEFVGVGFFFFFKLRSRFQQASTKIDYFFGVKCNILKKSLIAFQGEILVVFYFKLSSHRDDVD